MIKFKKLSLALIGILTIGTLTNCTTNTEVPAPVVNTIVEDKSLKGWKAGNLNDYITNYADVESTIKEILNKDDITIKQSDESASEIGTLENFGTGYYYIIVNNLEMKIKCENYLATNISYETGLGKTKNKNINTNTSIEKEDKPNIEITDSTKTSYNYIINNLSAEEIVEKCKYYFNNAPVKGQTYEDFYNTLEVQPVHKSELNLQFCEEGFEATTDDVINSIEYFGYKMEMDGTIGYQYENLYKVGISLTIQNYDKAATIYDKLAEIIQNDSSYQNVVVNREGTQWNTYAESYKFNDSNWNTRNLGNQYYTISMYKNDHNTFNIIIEHFITRK